MVVVYVQGTPDWMSNKWPTNGYPLLTEHPTAIEIGDKYQKSAAQIWLRWQWEYGIISNPRTRNVTHMMENMNIFDFKLSDDDMNTLNELSNIPPYPSNKICPDPNLWA